MKKRLAIFSAVTFSLFFLISCKKNQTSEISGCTNPGSFNYNATATQDDGSCKEMQGCLGYYSGYNNSGSVGNSFGNQYWDTKMSEEIYIQSTFFQGIPALVSVLYEPTLDQKNAYATQDGKILFGYYMFYYTIQNYGELPVAGILAHEWGHRTQFTLGWNDYPQNKHKELEADAFSGYYMALAKQFAWSQIESYYANVYASGDYNFNSPLHHGTQQQRLSSAYLGVQTALNAIQTNTQYSYNQLHNIFMQTISTMKINPNENRSYDEVHYPRVTKDYIKSLFPKL